MDKCNVSRFLSDVRNHEMTIISDNGVYRHINFSMPHTNNRHFNITTWDGHLCISGDMGTFVFARIHDMFEFFRCEKMRVNYSYWGEKLQSISRFAGYINFDEDMLRDSINARIDSLCESHLPRLYNEYDHFDREALPTLEAFTEAFKRDAKSHFDRAELDEHRFLGAIEDWTSTLCPDLGLFGLFGDDWDYHWIEHEEMSFNYKWCCHAIVWAIKQYDRHHNPIVIPSHYQALPPAKEMNL